MSKRFVQISNTSGVAINVTAGLQSINSTNYKSPKADRLSVKSAWTRMSVLIKAGSGFYPVEVKNWDSVKALVKDRAFAVGSEVDESALTPEELKECEEMERKLRNAKAKFDQDVKTNDIIMGKDATEKVEITAENTAN